MAESNTEVVTACLLIIGDEILSGRTRDANLTYLAKWLNEEGIVLREARVIPDIAAVIVATVREVRTKFDYVFTTGGIGPTHDDITAECVAEAFGAPLEFSDAAAAELMVRLTGPLNEGRRRMAMIPKGARLIKNPVSGAPGFILGNVHVMAGSPQVMQAMLETLRGSLRRGRKVETAAIHVYAGESFMAPTLSRVQNAYPDVAIGSYPFAHDDKYGASLVLRSADPARLAAALTELRSALAEAGFLPLDGEAPPHRAVS
ncbi:MAG: competence/damage-inducible protein A [Sphingomonadales bacterium]|nr:competence/damage-inducible protein A [Sphingomonadales bacterium]